MVAIDLERFFDRVCHDRLRSKLAERIADKRVLKLLRAYLQAGILEDGLVGSQGKGHLKAVRCRPSFPRSWWTSRIRR